MRAVRRRGTGGVSVRKYVDIVYLDIKRYGLVEVLADLAFPARGHTGKMGHVPDP